METQIVHLYKATDAEDTFAILIASDKPGLWRAERGFGQKFGKVWSVEIESNHAPDPLATDWDSVLERVIEAYNLSDPVLAKFEWPVPKSTC